MSNLALPSGASSPPGQRWQGAVHVPARCVQHGPQQLPESTARRRQTRARRGWLPGPLSCHPAELPPGRPSPRPTLTSHRGWARGHSHASTQHSTPQRQAAGRPVHAQPLHTRHGGRCAECPRPCAHVHAVRRRPAVSRPRSHAGPRSRGLSGPGSARASAGRSLTGLGGAAQAGSCCSDPGREQGHNELGTCDEDRPSPPAALTAGVPVTGTRKRCSWPGGGHRAETGGLSPGPAEVWGKLLSQGAVLPSQ